MPVNTTSDNDYVLMYDTTYSMANKNRQILNTKDFEWKFFQK